MAVVAPQSYYTAAEACYKLSTEFQSTYNPLQTALLETSGMAGSCQATKAWSDAYDERAGAFTLAATNFARALQHFGDILIASGYNWECSNYAANRDPNKGTGPACPRPIPSELPYGAGIVVGVASSRNNGPGIETDFPELYDKVIAKLAGDKLPDGDVYKLDRAAKEWKLFAGNNTIFAAGPRLRVVADGLGRFGADDIPNLTGHLRTLAKNADEIKLVADDLAKSTAEHHAAVVAVRADINTQVAAIVVVAAIGFAVAAVVIRNPKAATVDGTVLEGAATAMAGAVSTFFTALAGIKFSAAALAAGALATITGLTILSIAGDSTFNANYKPPANAYDPDGAKAPGRPGDAEGFAPPKGGDRWVPNPNGRGFGWEDADGNVWVPTGQGGAAHGGPHWDVEFPKGGYKNVRPGGGS
ncbi:polymorphic toxin type 37 domain-containing protein [Nocardia sp. NPDC051052]|uniref:polymorphic toxin type 37 domain-containing protein n=1 Tax=Nocardia sp. NPDC051052 TaxID=3364322 RepID=UPI0037B10E2D